MVRRMIMLAVAVLAVEASASVAITNRNLAAVRDFARRKYVGEGTNDQHYVYKVFNFGPLPFFALGSAHRLVNFCFTPIGTRCVATCTHFPAHRRGKFKAGQLEGVPTNWTSLRDWALANRHVHGWTEQQIEAQVHPDISVSPINWMTNGVLALDLLVPEDLPYLMSPAYRERRFGREFAGLAGWTVTQATYHRHPVIVMGAPPGAVSTVQFSLAPRSGLLQSALLREWQAIEPCYRAYSGDSGHPIWFETDTGECILISHFTSPWSGPDYCMAYPYLKAYNESIGSLIRPLE